MKNFVKLLIGPEPALGMGEQIDYPSPHTLKSLALQPG